MGKLYFKLAKTNLSNNKPFYIPYIISSIITVAMLYMMSFLSDNKGLNKIMGADSLASIFRLGVGIIVIFSYIFLFYTNSFIIKRRKKEIGVYNILGMEKRHLSKVLFVETIRSHGRENKILILLYLFCNNLSGMRNYRGNSIF